MTFRPLATRAASNWSRSGACSAKLTRSRTFRPSGASHQGDLAGSCSGRFTASPPPGARAPNRGRAGSDPASAAQGSLALPRRSLLANRSGTVVSVLRYGGSSGEWACRAGGVGALLDDLGDLEHDL